MRSRLRLFALVGVIATAVDFFVFRSLASRGLVRADILALALAALFAYVGNRFLTFRDAKGARWVRQPSLFALTAGFAGIIDVATVVAGNALGFGLDLVKVVAIALAAVVRWTAYRLILFRVVRREMGERRQRPPVDAPHRLSVVVPAYNEGERIGQTVAELRAAIEPVVGRDDLEILVVDDGSSDNTVELATKAGATVFAQPQNRGKGAAVRAGVIAATGRSVVFTDADLAYPPVTVLQVLEELEKGWDVVAGSRRHEETTTLVKARRVRELGGRLVNWLTHLVLLGHFRDTQCGIKGFRGDIGRLIFERCKIDGFAFDVEIFLISEQDRLSLTEVPVAVENRQASSVRLVGDTLKLLQDLLIVRRAAGKGLYKPNPQQLAILNERVDEADPSTRPSGSQEN